MARKDNDLKKKRLTKVFILLAILLGLLLFLGIVIFPLIIKEYVRRSLMLANVPEEVIYQGLSRELHEGASWDKDDLDRIVGVELRESETTMCGYDCMKYWNNRNVPTEFDDLRFYVFANKRDAKAALSYIKETLGEITDEGDNYVRGWESGVIDASIENYYYVDKNLMVVTTVTAINDMAVDENNPISPIMGGGQEALDLIQLINNNF